MYYERVNVKILSKGDRKKWNQNINIHNEIKVQFEVGKVVLEKCEKHKSFFMVKVSIELKFVNSLLYPSSTVLEHSTYNPRAKHLNPTVGNEREKW